MVFKDINAFEQENIILIFLDKKNHLILFKPIQDGGDADAPLWLNHLTG